MNGLFLRESSRGIESIQAESLLLKERKLFFTEEVNAESCNKLIQYLLCLESENADEEIVLYINTPGGEVASGLAVYDTMRLLSCPIRTVCMGLAASMGSIFFLAGDQREMLPHTKIMIHDPMIMGISGSRKALELEKEVDRLLELRETIGGIIAERSGHSLEEILEKTKEDTFLTAKEALDFGIATSIVDHV